jgi:hypothetical protein
MFLLKKTLEWVAKFVDTKNKKDIFCWSTLSAATTFSNIFQWVQLFYHSFTETDDLTFFFNLMVFIFTMYLITVTVNKIIKIKNKRY